VCVNIRHSVLERNITGQRQNFDLLVDWNLFIFLSFRLEETKNNIIECADAVKWLVNTCCWVANF